ncbi:vitamin B6 photo-protection and homoeostasis-domain-containing protein [Obelidium mucronatum]|nr:vitamin B6 photo-protection and homoeostasis-domain-containing protein [Obelidium mucronatum]
MLESLGISSPAATGGAVAIQWVLKDQFGEIGKLIFINRFAKSLDSHPKTWKFVGEVASLSGAFMQLCTILNPSTAWFLTFASFGYMMRSIHFSIYNSTHMTFTRNFALQGNVGDIVAKDDSQQTIAHLCGLLTGISLLTFSHSPAFLFACFFLVGPIHYYATIAFLNATHDAYVNRNGVVLDYNTIEKEGNTVWFGEWIKKGWNGVKISKIGGSVEHVFGNDVANARDALEVLREEDYLIGYRKDTKSFGITFHQDVSVNDVMKAIVHDSNVQLDMKALLRETLEWTRLEYPKFAVELEARGWLTDSVFWGDEGNRSTWDRGEKEYTASSGK